ncbi:TPR repeat region-containing protein [Rhodococcus sp. SJ-3]|uniref:TPR repeat region-containing protein n=1 Tax=Rhodococcus sp. SJ-3 TaxID=3454628 RepID=UPI003F7A13DC
MTPTRTQVENWTPGSLLTWRDGWLSLGTSIEALFDTYVASVEKIDGQYWEGVAAEAAFERAHNDRTTARTIVDTLERVAETITTGYHAIKGNLDVARDALATAQENCFTITDNLEVIDPRTENDADREALRAGLQTNLQRYAGLAEQADFDLTRSLEEARTSLRLAFTSAAALGDTQATADAAALAAGDVGPETLHRIVESGTLTPEQLTDLRAGEPTSIPASQMEYLNTVARSLDTLSPRELEQLMSPLPEEARAALANSLQIISTDTVTVATSGDPEVPARGGIDLLPEGIRDSLSREDCVVHSVESMGGTALRQTTLHGVPDADAIASIVSAGDGEYRNGSELDKQLLAAGREYLDAQVTHDQDPQGNMTIFEVDGHTPGDPYLDPIFAAVSDDRVAIEQAVTDPNGSEFVRDVLTHSWSDESTVQSMFHFDELEGAVQDPNDAVDVAEAARSGQIMSAVASAMSTDAAWQQMSSIPGTNHQSIGEVNPELVRTISHSMTPYIPSLVSVEVPDRPGFDIEGWTDPEGSGSYRGSVNVFAVLSTDEEAGTHFQSHAMRESVAAQIRFGEDPDAPNSNQQLANAGQLLALTDKGIEMSMQDRYDDEAARDLAVYEQKANAYNAVTWLGGHVLPGTDLLFDTISAGGEPLKETVIGPKPDPAAEVQVNRPNFERLSYFALAAVQDFPESTRRDFTALFDDEGNLRAYGEIFSEERSQTHTRRADYTLANLLGRVGDTHALRIAYNEVKPPNV